MYIGAASEKNVSPPPDKIFFHRGLPQDGFNNFFSTIFVLILVEKCLQNYQGIIISKKDENSRLWLAEYLRRLAQKGIMYLF